MLVVVVVVVVDAIGDVVTVWEMPGAPQDEVMCCLRWCLCAWVFTTSGGKIVLVFSFQSIDELL